MIKKEIMMKRKELAVSGGDIPSIRKKKTEVEEKKRRAEESREQGEKEEVINAAGRWAGRLAVYVFRRLPRDAEKNVIEVAAAATRTTRRRLLGTYCAIVCEEGKR